MRYGVCTHAVTPETMISLMEQVREHFEGKDVGEIVLVINASDNLVVVEITPEKDEVDLQHGWVDLGFGEQVCWYGTPFPEKEKES